jgi:hypothetical protein
LYLLFRDMGRRARRILTRKESVLSIMKCEFEVEGMVGLMVGFAVESLLS